jgi:hypothetical protein
MRTRMTERTAGARNVERRIPFKVGRQARRKAEAINTTGAGETTGASPRPDLIPPGWSAGRLSLAGACGTAGGTAGSPPLPSREAPVTLAAPATCLPILDSSIGGV